MEPIFVENFHQGWPNLQTCICSFLEIQEMAFQKFKNSEHDLKKQDAKLMSPM